MGYKPEKFWQVLKEITFAFPVKIKSKKSPDERHSSKKG